MLYIVANRKAITDAIAQLRLDHGYVAHLLAPVDEDRVCVWGLDPEPHENLLGLLRKSGSLESVSTTPPPQWDM